MLLHLTLEKDSLAKLKMNKIHYKRKNLSNLNKLFNVKHSDLETLWLVNKFYVLIIKKQRLEVLKVAEEKAKYLRND